MKQILALALVAVLAGCSAKQQDKKLIVGTEPEFPPFEFVDKATKQIVGFDMDLMDAVAKAAGYEGIQVQPFAFDTLIAALEQKKIDVIAAGMTITPERAQKVNFSEPYYDAAQVIVVADKTSGLTQIDDLKEKRVAVQLGTTGDIMAGKVMGERNPNLKQFTKYNEVFTELRLGRVDAVVVDMPVAQNYVKRMPGMKISSAPMSQEQFGFAIAKDNPALAKKLNDGLKAIRADGTFDKIMEKWFGEKAPAKE